MSKNDDIDKDIIDKFLFDETLPEEEITKRQWRIIDAAIKVFSEKGFDGSRTSEIAKEAEVAEGTIFRYYKTKKDLLLGLLFPMVTKFFRPLVLNSVEKIVDNKENKTSEELISDLLFDRLQLAKKNFPLVKTVMMEASYHSELLEPLQRDIAPKVIAFIDNFFEKNKASGEFRDIETRGITRTLMSMLMGYMVLTNLFPDQFNNDNDKEEMKKIADIFLNGVKNKERDEN